MIRTAIDYNRKELKFSAEPYNGQETDEYFIDPEVLNKLYTEDLLKKIQQLPDATRVIFNLSVIDGYSHKEISDQLQIGESTSRWHLSEAKKKLRALLQIPEKGPAELINKNKAT
jgi:RNA polymerase sigma factor (sigma-70 family)